MKMKAANPKTQRYLDFWRNNLPIAGQMPIVFRAENVEWHSLTCSCNRCEQDLPDEYVRGTVTSSSFRREVPFREVGDERLFLIVHY